MPKVKPLTQEQKHKRQNEARMAAIADGLAAYKQRNGFTLDQMADELNIGRSSAIKLLGQQDVMLTPKALWLVLSAAGFEIKKRPVDLG